MVASGYIIDEDYILRRLAKSNEGWVLGKPLRDRTADAACGPGDDGDALIEINAIHRLHLTPCGFRKLPGAGGTPLLVPRCPTGKCRDVQWTMWNISSPG
jgi:hypothetical protein